MRIVLIVAYFISSAFSVNGQSSFFENQKGVKRIKHTKKAGDVKRPQFFYGSEEFFDEEGHLIRVHRGPKSEANYIYQNDTIIQASTVADCTSAWYYFNLKRGNKTYTKSGKYFKNGYWGSACSHKNGEVDFPIDGTLSFNDSFPDVLRTLDLVDDFYKTISISEYKKDSLIHLIFNYELAKDSSHYELSWINMDQNIEGNHTLVQVFRIDKNGGGDIILNYQAIKDQQGSYTRFLDKNKLYQLEDKIVPRYKYEFDERGNWIKRILINPKRNRMEESYREYGYY